MAKPSAASVGQVSWEYVPKKLAHSGTLKVSIPGRSSQGDLQFNLRCFINDQRPAKRSSQPDDPLYNTSDSPFIYFVDVRRHKKGELVIKTDEQNQQRRQPEFSTMQFEYTTVSIQIFALRGVKVYTEFDRPDGKVKQMFEPLRQSFGRLTIEVKVNIFQDRSQLPAPGEPVENSQVFPSFESDNDHLGGNPLRRSLSRVSIKYIPNGIEFTWFPLGQTLRLELAKPAAGNSGFSYYINPEVKFPSDFPLYFPKYDNLLHIRTFGEVQKTLTPVKNPIFKVKDPAIQGVYYRSNFVDPVVWAEKGHPAFRRGKRSLKRGHFRPDRSIHRPLHEARFFRIEQVGSLDQLPPPHTPFSIKPIKKSDKRNYEKAKKEYLSYYTEPDLPLLIRLAMDLGIGVIPIAGDLVDYAEFNLMLATGKDRWGKDVDDLDIFLAGLSVIPVLGIVGNIAKSAKRAIP